MTVSIVKADCIDFLRSLPPDSVDLVFGSPPYEDARLYLENGINLGASRKTDAWVAWMVEVYKAAQVACKGLVAFVVAGQTNDYRWSAGPALLMAELRHAGMNLRNPAIYQRDGIPGSGGPDWLQNKYEWIVCTSRPGRLPWSENTAMGHAPKYGPGGAPSHRKVNGERVNYKNGAPTQEDRKNRGSHRARRDAGYTYVPPEKSNPGNIIYCGAVGGGNMGEDAALSHLNEAPFPEALAEFFVCSFAPPKVCSKCGMAVQCMSEVRPHHRSDSLCMGCGTDLTIPGAIRPGLVCDPFSGSGTTAAMSVKHGRNFVGCDLRQSQVDLGLKRVAQVTPLALFA